MKLKTNLVSRCVYSAILTCFSSISPGLEPFFCSRPAVGKIRKREKKRRQMKNISVINPKRKSEQKKINNNDEQRTEQR